MTAKKFFRVMIALVVLSFISIAAVFYWGSSQLEKRSATVSDLIADRDILQEQIIRLNKAQSDTGDLESTAEILNRLLPTEKQQESLIADIIYTATSEAGIPFNQVKSFSFSGGSAPDALSGATASKEVPGVYEYPFDMSIDSISYDTLLKLLVEIETNGRIIQVASVQISPQTSGLLTIGLSMKAYIKP